MDISSHGYSSVLYNIPRIALGITPTGRYANEPGLASQPACPLQPSKTRKPTNGNVFAAFWSTELNALRIVLGCSQNRGVSFSLGECLI